jgi:hypothetical protein
MRSRVDLVQLSRQLSAASAERPASTPLRPAARLDVKVQVREGGSLLATLASSGLSAVPRRNRVR